MDGGGIERIVTAADPQESRRQLERAPLHVRQPDRHSVRFGVAVGVPRHLDVERLVAAGARHVQLLAAHFLDLLHRDRLAVHAVTGERRVGVRHLER